MSRTFVCSQPDCRAVYDGDEKQLWLKHTKTHEREGAMVARQTEAVNAALATQPYISTDPRAAAAVDAASDDDDDEDEELFDFESEASEDDEDTEDDDDDDDTATKNDGKKTAVQGVKDKDAATAPSGQAAVHAEHAKAHEAEKAAGKTTAIDVKPTAATPSAAQQAGAKVNNPIKN